MAVILQTVDFLDSVKELNAVSLSWLYSDSVLNLANAAADLVHLALNLGIISVLV